MRLDKLTDEIDLDLTGILVAGFTCLVIGFLAGVVVEHEVWGPRADRAALEVPHAH